MKRIYLTAVFLAFANLMNAQITILDEDGNVIEDGSVFEFNTVDEGPWVENPESKLSFYIQNDTSSPIEVKAAMVEIVGSNGSGVQFCMGDCLNVVNENSVVPVGNSSFPIGANQTTGEGIYFWNLSSSSEYASYKFKVYQVDSSGNEIGASTHITYVYSATASTPNMTLQKLGVQVNNTLVNNEFLFTTTSAMNMELFDVNGRKVLTESFAEGTNVYDISDLNAGVYIARFTDKNNSSASIKIVKK